MRFPRLIFGFIIALLVWQIGANAQAQEVDSTTIETALERLNSTKKQEDKHELEDAATWTLYGAVEVNWIRPTLATPRNTVSGDVTNRLDWSLSPRISLGADMNGYTFLTSYQFFSTVGDNSSLAGRAHLDEHFLDFDVKGESPTLRDGPGGLWVLGLRLAYFGTSIHPFASNSEHIRNDFAGIGPRLGFGGSWTFASTGLQVFARADGSFLAGIDVVFADDHDRNDPSSQALGAQSNPLEEKNAACLVTGHVEAGVAWSHRFEETELRLAGGYEFEWWRFFAPTIKEPLQPSVTIGNDIWLRARGIFVRCEYHF